MGQAFVGHGVGAPAYTGIVRCVIDHSDAGQNAFLGSAPLSLTLQPEGVGSGLAQIVFSEVFVSGRPRTWPSEEFSTIEFNWVGNSLPDETPQT